MLGEKGKRWSPRGKREEKAGGWPLVKYRSDANTREDEEKEGKGRKRKHLSPPFQVDHQKPD